MKRMEEFQRPITENQLKQADRPKSSEVLLNNAGMAPGFKLKYKECLFIALPGVPYEFDSMVEEHIISLLKQPGFESLQKKLFRSFGLFESQVDDLLSDLPKKWPEVRLGYRAHFPEIIISLKASPRHLQPFEDACHFVKKKLGHSIFSEKPGPFAETLIQILKSKGKTLSLAESCTGGLIGHLLTEIPGASDVFTLGFITYSNQNKKEFLGVKQETLDTFGAVSEETVIEMAEKIRSLSKADYSLAISGVAGPGGGSKEKPVGTLWIALGQDGPTETKKLQFSFDRKKNKIIGAYSALDLLRRRLQYS
jgi:nicotinamide-nucleotide amidase